MRKNHQILSTNSNANYQLSLGSLSSNWLRKHVSGDRESETYDRLWMHLLIGFLGSSWAYIVFFNVALRGCILTQTSHMVMGSKAFLIGQKSWWTSWWANVKVPKTCTTRWRGLVSWHCLIPGLNFQGVMHVEDLTCQGLRVCVFFPRCPFYHMRSCLFKYHVCDWWLMYSPVHTDSRTHVHIAGWTLYHHLLTHLLLFPFVGCCECR